MELTLPLLTLAMVTLLSAMSPGPAFLVVSSVSLANRRAVGLAAAVGAGLGAATWALAALVGLAIILESAVWLYSLMKVGAGIYLLYLAFKLWRHATDDGPRPSHARMPNRPSSAFATAYLTMLTNPKALVFYGSIFTAILPANPPEWVLAAALGISLGIETAWYLFVSIVFSLDRPQRLYRKAKLVFDRSMASILALLGLHLILEALPGRTR